VLEGSIASLGSQLFWACAPGIAVPATPSMSKQVQVARKEDVLNALGQIATKFRTRAGESLATVERYSTPLAGGHNTVAGSVESLQHGLEGVRFERSSAALPFFNVLRRSTPNSRRLTLGWGGGIPNW